MALEFELKAHLWEDVEIAGHVGPSALVEFDRIDVLATVNIDDVREGDHADITEATAIVHAKVQSVKVAEPQGIVGNDLLAKAHECRIVENVAIHHEGIGGAARGKLPFSRESPHVVGLPRQGQRENMRSVKIRVVRPFAAIVITSRTRI